MVTAIREGSGAPALGYSTESANSPLTASLTWEGVAGSDADWTPITYGRRGGTMLSPGPSRTPLTVIHYSTLLVDVKVFL